MSGAFGMEREHSKHKSVEWYSPGWVFDGLELTFDVDPCSPFDMETVVPARVKYTVFDDGLAQPWYGRVWLNPPYGLDTALWMQRMIEHAHGIAMVFSRTDAAWCQDALKSADAFLFLSGRVNFIPGLENQHKKSRSGAGSVMLAWGEDCVAALKKLSCRGVFVSSDQVAPKPITMPGVRQCDLPGLIHAGAPGLAVQYPHSPMLRDRSGAAALQGAPHA